MPQVHKVYPAFIKGSSEEVMAFDEQFLTIWAALGCSKTKAINQVFQAGLEAIVQLDEFEGQVDKTGFNIYRKIREINSRRTLKGNLEFLYEHLPLDEFRQFCTTNDIDADHFLKMYRAAPPSPDAKGKIINDWLQEHLADHNEHAITDIQKAIMEQDIIVSKDDWNYVKNIASREGYSSNAKRGYWKL